MQVWGPFFWKEPDAKGSKNRLILKTFCMKFFQKNGSHTYIHLYNIYTYISMFRIP